MARVPDTILADIADLSTSKEKIRISQTFPKWNSFVDRDSVRENCHMRMQDAKSKHMNALWKRSDEEREGALHLGGRVAEVWGPDWHLCREHLKCLMETLHRRHLRCLSKCLGIMCKGCGTEDAELRAYSYWERSFGYELQMSRSLLLDVCTHDSEERRPGFVARGVNEIVSRLNHSQEENGMIDSEDSGQEEAEKEASEFWDTYFSGPKSS